MSGGDEKNIVRKRCELETVNPLGDKSAWRLTRMAVNHQSTYYLLLTAKLVRRTDEIVRTKFISASFLMLASSAPMS